MSDSPLAGAKTPKTMSSRLLTMKFMQRAAAAASPAGSNLSSPGTKSPESGSQSQEESSSLRPPKRSKLSHVPRQTESSGAVVPSTKAADIRAALLSAETTRQAALERSRKGEETKWAFAVRNDAAAEQVEHALRVEMLKGRVASGEDDGREDEVAAWSLRSEEGQGRRVFGRKQKSISTGATADEESDESGDPDDSEDSLDVQIREVLNQPDHVTSNRSNGVERRIGRISGGVQNLDRMQCHACEEFGHLSRNCPNRWKKQQHQPIGSRSAV